MISLISNTEAWSAKFFYDDWAGEGGREVNKKIDGVVRIYRNTFIHCSAQFWSIVKLVLSLGRLPTDTVLK